MKVLGIIVNIFLPGVGTMIAGRAGLGFGQLVLWLIGLFFSLTVIGIIIGYPIMFVAWLWGIISVASMDDKPVQVVIIDERPATKPDTGSAPAGAPEPSRSPERRTVTVTQGRQGSGGGGAAVVVILGLIILSVSSYWYYSTRMKQVEFGPPAQTVPESYVPQGTRPESTPSPSAGTAPADTAMPPADSAASSAAPATSPPSPNTQSDQTTVPEPPSPIAGGDSGSPPDGVPASGFELPGPPSVVASLQGKWTGIVTQSDGQSYSVIIEFLQPSQDALVSYPELRCGGRLLFQGREGSSFVYRERLDGVSRCVTGGTVHLTPFQDSVRYRWTEPGSPAAWATLARM